MLTHTVLIKPRVDATPSEFEALGRQAAALAGRLCGEGNYEVGPNSTRESLDQGYSFGFIMRFRDREALATYHQDPAHEPFSQRIQALAETVLVFDLES